VSDYSRLVARGLAVRGYEVHVFAPHRGESLASEDGVTIHPLKSCFGPGVLREVGRQLDSLPRETRVLVQYVPHAFGYRAMNVAFAAWLLARSSQHHIDVMFHEVRYGFEGRQPLRHNFLAAVNWLMAAAVARAAERIFVSIPAWERLVQPVIGRARAVRWVPVPSNLPTQVCSEHVNALKAELGIQPVQSLIGHFGTYGPLIASMLLEILPALLADESCRLILLGRAGHAFREKLIGVVPTFKDRVVAAGAMPPSKVAEHLAACDVLVQPYPDGISTRRSSAMAGLALGCAIVSCGGALSEPIWRESGAVALADDSEPKYMLRLAQSLLADPALRAQVGARGQALYEAKFSIERTIDTLSSE